MVQCLLDEAQSLDLGIPQLLDSRRVGLGGFERFLVCSQSSWPRLAGLGDHRSDLGSSITTEKSGNDIDRLLRLISCNQHSQFKCTHGWYSITVCPAASIARRVLSSALVTGGKGLTIPSSTNIPKHNLDGRSIIRHGIGTIFGSDSQPSESTIAFANSSREETSADISPLILRTASCPGKPDRAPYLTISIFIPSREETYVEKRPKDGLRAYSPVKEAGILTLPPISLPIPIGVPLKARSELSPPEEPPLLNRVLYGFVVYPKTLLYVSGIIIAVGTFLFVSVGLGVNVRFTQDNGSKIFQLPDQDALLLRSCGIICPCDEA